MYIISDIGTIMWPIASANIQPYEVSYIVQIDLLKNAFPGEILRRCSPNRLEGSIIPHISVWMKNELLRKDNKKVHLSIVSVYSYKLSLYHHSSRNASLFILLNGQIKVELIFQVSAFSIIFVCSISRIS